MTHGLIDDYRWLLSEEAARWLEDIAAVPKSLVVQTKRLRRSLSARRTHLLLELHELRRRARVKFLAADRMFFTARALEQATDQWIARHKAQRFAAGQPIADLCCGIGGDLFGLAQRASVTGVDRDPVHALLAAENCRVLGLKPQQVEVADAASVDLGRFAAWHMDPDRRSATKRTTQLGYSQPPLPVIDQMLGQLPHAALKLAPAADIPDRWTAIAERQWIGSGRECRQQVMWFGELAHHFGQHTAVVAHHRSLDSDCLVGAPAQVVDISSRIDEYIFEPHATVVAAQLTGTLAAKYSLRGLDPKVAYLTSHQPVRDPLISCFAVLDIFPLDMRHLQQALAHRNIGHLEVKKRGIRLDPELLRKKLQGRGEQTATLLLTPHSGSVRAVLCRRVTEEAE